MSTTTSSTAATTNNNNNNDSNNNNNNNNNSECNYCTNVQQQQWEMNVNLIIKIFLGKA